MSGTEPRSDTKTAFHGQDSGPKIASAAPLQVKDYLVTREVIDGWVICASALKNGIDPGIAISLPIRAPFSRCGCPLNGISATPDAVLSPLPRPTMPENGTQHDTTCRFL